jgi:hypothetical protein
VFGNGLGHYKPLQEFVNQVKFYFETF